MNLDDQITDNLNPSSNNGSEIDPESENFLQHLANESPGDPDRLDELKVDQDELFRMQEGWKDLSNRVVELEKRIKENPEDKILQKELNEALKKENELFNAVEGQFAPLSSEDYSKMYAGTRTFGRTDSGGADFQNIISSSMSASEKASLLSNLSSNSEIQSLLNSIDWNSIPTEIVNQLYLLLSNPTEDNIKNFNNNIWKSELESKEKAKLLSIVNKLSNNKETQNNPRDLANAA